VQDSLEHIIDIVIQRKETMGVIRKHYYVSGRVQGVGFRYRAYHTANSLRLTGYVKNLYDGRVELEVQGERDMVERFLGMVEQGTWIHIDGIESENMDVIEDERSFRTEY
jgi:acylphosphatase